MFEWFPRGATGAELVVVRAILGDSDPRAHDLFEQFRTSRRIKRHVEGTRMRATVPWTTEELLVDLDVDVASAPAQVHDRRSGQLLRFQVHLARGGFFRSLEGQAETRWPRRWEVDPDELEAAASGALRLPADVSPDALAQWLGITIPEDQDVVARRPATSVEVERLRKRAERALPAQLREFLAISNGALVGDWAILGVRDLHVVELPTDSYWQIAVGTAAGDDRRCLAASDGTLLIAPSHDSDSDHFETVGNDLRTWVAGLASR